MFVCVKIISSEMNVIRVVVKGQCPCYNQNFCSSGHCWVMSCQWDPPVFSSWIQKPNIYLFILLTKLLHKVVNLVFGLSDMVSFIWTRAILNDTTPENHLKKSHIHTHFQRQIWNKNFGELYETFGDMDLEKKMSSMSVIHNPYFHFCWKVCSYVGISMKKETHTPLWINK